MRISSGQKTFLIEIIQSMKKLEMSVKLLSFNLPRYLSNSLELGY